MIRSRDSTWAAQLHRQQQVHLVFLGHVDRANLRTDTNGDVDNVFNPVRDLSAADSTRESSSDVEANDVARAAVSIT